MSKLGTVFRFVVARTYLWRLDPRFRGSNPKWMTVFLFAFLGVLIVLTISLALSLVFPNITSLYDLEKSEFLLYCLSVFFFFCILQYFGWVRHDKQDKYVRELQAMSAATVERWTKAFISLSLLLVLMALISAYIAGRLVTTSKMGF